MAPLLLLFAPLPFVGPAPAEAVYKTPQAVFDAAQKASETKDFKTAFQCTAPEARKLFAGQLVQGALPEFAGLTSALDAVLGRHGLDAKALDAIDRADPRKAVESYGGMVKKPEEFCIEMMKAQDKAGRDLLAKLGQPVPELTLSGVRIDGNKAAGRIVTEAGAIKVEHKAEFVKGKHGWRMLPAVPEDVRVLP
ncbi:MAG: hypothetical protein K2W96_21065 [Gemmataceae bacterium]|nr:hypothetical protein [Gemmataceae bacterium]